MVTIERVEKGRSRYYEVTGDPSGTLQLPSVTTVLGIIAKPALVGWAKKISLEKVRAELEMLNAPSQFSQEWIDNLIEAARKRPDQVRDEASEWGTEAHLRLSDYIEGKRESWESESEYMTVIHGYDQWLEENSLVVDRTEWMVYSPEGYAGTVDIGGVSKAGVKFIADLKTGSGVYKEAALQLAAYAKADSEMTLVPVEEAWILHIPRKHPDFSAAGSAYNKNKSSFTAHLLTAEQLEMSAASFLAALRLYTGLKEKLWD